MADTPDAYLGYDDWKGWNERSFMALDPQEAAYLSREVGQVSLAGRKVLEIGFGNGTFLAFAKAHGAQVFGTELSDQGRRLAAERGVEVLPADLAQLGSEMDGQFDFVAAFDVLEHLAPSDISALFDQLTRLLAPGGRFLARFPNGQGPFGRVNQAADHTHRTTVSVPMLEQLARGKPLRVIAVGDDMQVVYGSTATRLKQRAQIWVRRRAEALIKWTFRFDAPMGLNTTVTFERA